MISVPDAIRIVLRETARLLLVQHTDWISTAQLLMEQAHTDTTTTANATDTTTKIANLLGRIVAQDVIMREPGYPPYAASVMDGYAMMRRHSDAAATQENATTPPATTMTTTGDKDDNIWTHCVVGKIYAGDETKTNYNNDSNTASLPMAYYITTGAAIPDNCDCVVPSEDVEVCPADPTRIRLIHGQPSANAWIRPPGSDIAAGTVLLKAGDALTPIALGLLLQSGVSRVALVRPVTVGVVSTGSELLSLPSSSNSSLLTTTTTTTTHNDNNINNNSSTAPDWWSNLPHGIIPDVNRPVLLALLSCIPNVRVVDLGKTRDDNADETERIFRTAMEECDVIVSTGGISMGETDIVEHVLVERLQCRLHFGRLHMKPGKPTTFVTNTIKQCLVFAIPGNPVSAVVCTQLLVIPCLHLLTTGDTSSTPSTMTAPPQLEAKESETTVQRIHRIVQHAYVHAEDQGVLCHDVKLDFERPEYHRVYFKDRSKNLVQSTGMQQSSRLLSLRDAEGLLLLPQATKERFFAAAGESFPLLFLLDSNTNINNSPNRTLIQVRHSNHLKIIEKPKVPLQIGIVLVAPDYDTDKDVTENRLLQRVEKALSGFKNGSALVTSSRVYSDVVDRFCSSIQEDDVDVLVVACLKAPGSFRYHIKLANLLRCYLTKVASSMALHVRQGAATQASTAAIFETVIGYRSNGRGSIVVLIPEEGLDQGLQNIHGVLRHAIRTARGDNDHSLIVNDALTQNQ